MKKTLLVVDDTPDITYTIKMLFEEVSDEYRVIISESGEDCLKLINEDYTPDVIILDIMLPGIDGWETYEKIKKNEKWSKIPVIILTACTDDFTRKIGRHLGDDYIEKPFEFEDLKNKIDKVISK
jgi:DNA-binding response OmpR family regulator